MTRASQTMWNRHLPALVAVASLAIGILVGADAVGMSDDDDDLLLTGRLVPVIIEPPAMHVPKDGFAIVGSADGRYYIVRENGEAEMIYPTTRQELFWRDP